MDSEEGRRFAILLRVLLCSVAKKGHPKTNCMLPQIDTQSFSCLFRLSWSSCISVKRFFSFTRSSWSWSHIFRFVSLSLSLPFTEKDLFKSHTKHTLISQRKSPGEHTTKSLLNLTTESPWSFLCLCLVDLCLYVFLTCCPCPVVILSKDLFSSWNTLLLLTTTYKSLVSYRLDLFTKGKKSTDSTWPKRKDNK